MVSWGWWGLVKEPFLLCALRSVEGNTGEGMRCVPFSYLFLWLFRFPLCGSKIGPGEREGEMPITASLFRSALASPLFFHSNSWIACVYMCLCAWVGDLLQQTVHSWAHMTLKILTIIGKRRKNTFYWQNNEEKIHFMYSFPLMHNTFMCQGWEIDEKLSFNSLSSRLRPLRHSATPTSVLMDGVPTQTSHTSTRFHVFVIILDGFYLVPSVLVAHREGKAFRVEAE